MKLKELLETLSESTEVLITHAVLKTVIPESDYNTDWMVVTVRALKKNLIRISVI